MIDFKPVLTASSSQSHRTARRDWLWGAGVSVLAVGAIAAATLLPIDGAPTRSAAAQSAPPPAVPVSLATVHRADTLVWANFSGRLEAVNRVELRPRAAGAITATHFREGALVKQGDLLFTIDPAPYAAEVDRLQAQLTAAGARLVLTAREQQRGLRLGSSNDLSQSSVDQKVNDFKTAEATLRATQAELDTAKLNLGYTEVRAPISGRVGRIEVTQGNLVPAGATAPILTTLVSVDPIYASFDADEVSVARAVASLPASGDLADKLARIPVQLGTLATDGTPLTGTLQLVDNVVDGASGTMRLRAVFANHDGRLIPGQFARIRLGAATTTPLIAIDERAIGTDQDHRYVMVAGPGNIVSARQVHLGGSVDGRRIVTDGLQPGERIVVDGLQRVRPGARVADDAKLASR